MTNVTASPYPRAGCYHARAGRRDHGTLDDPLRIAAPELDYFVQFR
jgi:hypothetical protein